MFRRLTAENLTQVHEFSAVKTASPALARSGPSLAVSRARFRLKAFHCHCAQRVTACWLIGALAALLSLSACRSGVPVLDTSPKPLQADGTISGTARGPAGTSPIDGRTVEVVNIDTGERLRTATNIAGGFTFKVKPGKYRVELTLRDGESLVKQPGVINVNRSDVDANADFVVGASGIVRPRYHAPRADDGLGSAVA
jgi:hypothetical protein